MLIYTDEEVDMLIEAMGVRVRAWERELVSAGVAPPNRSAMMLKMNVLKAKLYADKARRVEPKVHCGSCCEHRCECLCHLFDDARAQKEIS